MRTVTQIAMVDTKLCNGCGTCSKLCPTFAITLSGPKRQQKALIDAQACVACGHCSDRCLPQAITLGARAVPLTLGVDLSGMPAGKIEAICHAAHMYPDQIVCDCNRVQANEIAAAILQGARTPEEIARRTRARTGCGVLCISGVVRLLRSAGVDLDHAPGNQWYGTEVSIWSVPPEVARKYPEYYLAEDRELLDKVFPGGTK